MTWFLGSHLVSFENTFGFYIPGLALQGLQQDPVLPFSFSGALVAAVLSFQAVLIGILLYDRARRRRAGKVLRAAARTFDTTGDTFFRSLTEHLNSLLRADYVSIGELSDDGLRMRTVAVSADGRNLENLEYLLEHTPCRKVLDLGRYFDRKDVQLHFPEDSFLKEFRFQSYLGVALLDSSRRPLGVMSVLSRRPSREGSVVEVALDLLAARVAAEMERRRSQRALESSQARNSAILKGMPYL